MDADFLTINATSLMTGQPSIYVTRAPPRIAGARRQPVERGASPVMGGPLLLGSPWRLVGTTSIRPSTVGQGVSRPGFGENQPGRT